MGSKTRLKLVEEGWPAKYSAVIKELRSNDTVLDELLGDHARLIKAISYWRTKSPDKTEEFREMADELEIEISTIISRKLS